MDQPSDAKVSMFICPPKCDAGGTPENEGHIFDIPVETDTFSGAKCKCGLWNIDFDLMRMP